MNDTYEANETYVASIELDSTNQSYDESSTVGDSTLASMTGGTGGYGSQQRVPPSINVALYPLNENCARKSDTRRAIKNFSWKFYVLRTAASEISAAWNMVGWKSNAAAIQNYAWRIKQDGAKSGIGGAEIENTTNHQCFKPWKKVPTKWKNWLADPVDERIANSSDDIQLTEYRAGTYSCQESAYPADGNKLSQLGSKARSESTTTSCGGDEAWRAIVQYYYTGTVKSGSAPKVPDISFTRPSGAIKFEFSATGGYKYNLQKYERIEGTWQWATIHVSKWSWKSRNIPKSFTYSTSTCRSYRVKATNPVGSSPFADYASGNTICPG